MNKLCIAFLFFAVHAAADFTYGVTYEFSGGRFGDNLLSYLHGKWLSYRYEIPLLYKPFKFSSDLAMHEKELHFHNNMYRNRARTHPAQIESDLQSSQPVLIVCPYFPEDPIERKEESEFFFDADWKNEKFREIVLEMIAPKRELRLIQPPDDTVNVAIHVRLGENYDDDAFRVRFPLKLPPLSFYLEALPKVLEYFRGKKIYCHVFTDAERPERIVETLKTAVPQGISVKFGWRRGLSLPTFNVLEDFFSLFHFDVLIRSQSHFSMVPSLLHDYAILCYPSDFIRGEEKFPTITKTEIRVDAVLYEALMRER